MPSGIHARPAMTGQARLWRESPQQGGAAEGRVAWLGCPKCRALEWRGGSTVRACALAG